MADAPKTMRIRVYPDAVLRRIAEPVGEAQLDDALVELARRMIATMYAEKGVGLAAPQVGESIRMIVLDETGERDKPKVLVNPVIVDAAGREVMEEGCLSLPGVNAKVRRRERIICEYETLRGEQTGVEAGGLLARILQHEIDHLDGKLFTDRLDAAGRMAVKRDLRELEETAGRK